MMNEYRKKEKEKNRAEEESDNEDGNNMFLRNVIYLQVYKALQPSRPTST
jgi:hypothetical protein